MISLLVMIACLIVLIIAFGITYPLLPSRQFYSDVKKPAIVSTLNMAVCFFGNSNADLYHLVKPSHIQFFNQLEALRINIFVFVHVWLPTEINPKDFPHLKAFSTGSDAVKTDFKSKKYCFSMAEMHKDVEMVLMVHHDLNLSKVKLPSSMFFNRKAVTNSEKTFVLMPKLQVAESMERESLQFNA